MDAQPAIGGQGLVEMEVRVIPLPGVDAQQAQIQTGTGMEIIVAHFLDLWKQGTVERPGLLTLAACLKQDGPHHFDPHFLIYGTGGFAYGEVRRDNNFFGGWWGNNNNNATKTGWTAGGGVEWMFMPNWSAKAEYLYTDLNSGGQTGPFGFQTGYHHHPQFNIVRAGVNYHFNFGGAAPVVAKY